MNIWRLETCKAATGYRSTASIYQLIKKGLWPKPVNINVRSVGWPDSEILAINAARIAGQTDDQIRDLVKRLHFKRNEQITTYSGDQNGA
jgi:prophage regulatory protein